MNNTTLRSLHATWAKAVLPTGCSQAQRQETERAFFAGAAALFGLVSREVALKSDDEAGDQMTEIDLELRDYFKLLGTIPGPGGTERQ